jgi:hypothetical protein
VVTNRREAATFVVALDREPGKWLQKDTDLLVFNRSGDMVYETTAPELGEAVRRFCTVSQRKGFGIPTDAH